MISIPFSGVVRNEMTPPDPSRARSRPKIVSTEGGLSPANLGLREGEPVDSEAAFWPPGG
jgi:hypothetical protein